MSISQASSGSSGSSRTSGGSVKSGSGSGSGETDAKRDEHIEATVPRPRKKFVVYRLLCEQGMRYVGITAWPKTAQIRFGEHMLGYGAEFTRRYMPVCVEHEFETDHPLDEDREVLECMQRYGIHKVRGGVYSQLQLPKYAFIDIQRKLAHSSGACLYCWQQGHFANTCPQKQQPYAKSKATRTSTSAASTTTASLPSLSSSTTTKTASASASTAPSTPRSRERTAHSMDRIRRAHPQAFQEWTSFEDSCLMEQLSRFTEPETGQRSPSLMLCIRQLSDELGRPHEEIVERIRLWKPTWATIKEFNYTTSSTTKSQAIQHQQKPQQQQQQQPFEWEATSSSASALKEPRTPLPPPPSSTAVLATLDPEQPCVIL